MIVSVEAQRDLKARFIKEILMMLAGLFGGITMKLFFMGRVALLKEVEISFQREIQFYLASGQALFENGPKNLVMQFQIVSSLLFLFPQHMAL
jgi:hypothetical protein